MELLDDIRSPSGRERVTRRPAWRVRVGPEQVRWAFVEEHNGQVWITGWAVHPVDPVRAPDPVAGLVVGGGAGALVGAALAGPAGAVVGGIIGALFGAGGGTAGDGR